LILVELALSSSGGYFTGKLPLYPLILFSWEASLKMCLKALLESKLSLVTNSSQKPAPKWPSLRLLLYQSAVQVLARIQPQSRTEIVSTEALAAKDF